MIYLMAELQDTLLRFVEALEGNKSQIEQGRSATAENTRRLEYMDNRLAAIQHAMESMAKAEGERSNLIQSVIKSPAFGAVVAAFAAAIFGLLGFRYDVVSQQTPATIEATK